MLLVCFPFSVQFLGQVLLCVGHSCWAVPPGPSDSLVCMSTQIRLAESSKYSAVHSLSWYLFSRSPSWYTPRPQRPFPGAVQKVSGVESGGVVCWDEEGIRIMSVGKWPLCIYGKFNQLFIFSPLNINSQMSCLIVGYDTVLNFAGGKVLEWEKSRTKHRTRTKTQHYSISR